MLLGFSSHDRAVIAGPIGNLFLLQHLSRIVSRHVDCLQKYGGKNDDEDDCECSDVDDRGIVSADDISLQPASYDRIGDRNSNN